MFVETQCVQCGGRYRKHVKTSRPTCADCHEKLASDNNLLAQLAQAGAAFFEIALNRLPSEQRLAAAEMLSTGTAKPCIVVDLNLSDEGITAARAYLHSKGAKPCKIGTLAAFEPTEQPTLN